MDERREGRRPQLPGKAAAAWCEETPFTTARSLDFRRGGHHHGPDGGQRICPGQGCRQPCGHRPRAGPLPGNRGPGRLHADGCHQHRDRTSGLRDRGEAGVPRAVLPGPVRPPGRGVDSCATEASARGVGQRRSSRGGPRWGRRGGIPADKLETIFEPFKQVGSTVQTATGPCWSATTTPPF